MFYSQEAEDHENDIRIALKEKRERDRQEEIETIRSFVRSVLAALSQKETHVGRPWKNNNGYFDRIFGYYLFVGFGGKRVCDGHLAAKRVSGPRSTLPPFCPVV